ADLVDLAGVEQEPFRHGRLAGVDVRDHTEVADEIDLGHGWRGIAQNLPSEVPSRRMRGMLVGVVISLAGSAAAQPAPPVDYAHAAELYKAAEAEVAADKLDDAIRDYSAAYDITKDPVLFYKIGVANQRASKCEVALVYFGRYLREGK